MYKLMLADDSEATQRIVTLTFENFDCQIICLSDGIEVVDYISHSLVDVMLVDVGLPGFDGYQLCEILQGDHRTSGIPIILMGSIKCPVDPAKSEKFNLAAVLEKPFETNQLEEIVKGLLPFGGRKISVESGKGRPGALDEALRAEILTSVVAESQGSVIDLECLDPTQLGAGTRAMPRKFMGQQEPVENTQSKGLTEEEYSRVVTLTLEKLSGKLKSIIPEAVDELIEEKHREVDE